jgi:hypothetical protein
MVMAMHTKANTLETNWRRRKRAEDLMKDGVTDDGCKDSVAIGI